MGDDSTFQGNHRPPFSESCFYLMTDHYTLHTGAETSKAKKQMGENRSRRRKGIIYRTSFEAYGKVDID